MHIKRITIQGFKTYKEATVIDFLSPKTNVVVGRNGSGKSNFFAAIRFVLSDAYTQMSREERQGLIHEGSGTVMSAYVEIVFDNSDGRFPVDKEQIIIRRTIGLQKDDYSINHKSAQRSDIMNLLESAGFSRTNPYYIVPQGRITALTNAKDSERLQLLKDVAGAQVFEQKLKQSLKEMNASQQQREKIDEMLIFIEERLDDLNSEKDELKEFKDLEQNKKFIEYTLYDREIADLDEQIESIDVQHTEELDNSNSYVHELQKRDDAISNMQEALVELKTKLNVLMLDEKQLDIDLTTNQGELAKETAIKNEIESDFENVKQQLDVELSNLKSLEDSITANKNAVESEKPNLESIKSKELELKKSLNESINNQRFLLDKQNRKSQFDSKSARDNWLKKNIEQITQKLKKSEGENYEQIRNFSTANENLTKIENEITEIQTVLNGEQSREESKELYNKLSNAKLKYSELIDERKQLWRLEARQKNLVDSTLEELENANRLIAETMDRSQNSGLYAVKQITEKLGLSGVYGPLGELIEVNPKYKTAAEVIAGNSLFHVVVDNDNTASVVMEELIREKLGRVTFIPLNRLDVKEQNYPTRNDCIPLIKKIAYDEKFEKAVKQVYSKAIVTISLDVGATIAKEFQLSAITLDGDRVDKKGVLSGGYRDHKRSRIDSLAIQRRRKAEWEEAGKELHEIKRKIEFIDKRITEANNIVTDTSKNYDNLCNSKEPLRNKLHKLQNEKLNLESESKSINLVMEANQRLTDQYKQQLASYNEEIATSFDKNQDLTQAEVQELERLDSRIFKYQRDLNEVTSLYTASELEISNKETELNSHLYPRHSQLILNVDNLKTELSKQNLAERESNLKNIEVEIEKLTERKQEIVKEIKEVSSEIENKEIVLTKIGDVKKTLSKKINNFQKISEKNLSKKLLFVNRRDDIQQKIRELGVLPEEAFTKYVNDDYDSLLASLNKINKKLTKYSHINRKALEQYLNFSKQRDELIQRRNESDKSKDSIENLIKVLEKRKSNAINRTFYKLSESFAEIFEQLVPAGIGRLIIQKEKKTYPLQAENASVVEEIRNSSENQVEDIDMATDDLDEEDMDVKNYTGISMSVSFNSKSDEQQRIEQLSGGQKSLCAIALILAVQKCDPAPFYLFDEIDANLDTQYRTAVASLIHELSGNAQFICTTFRPEILQIADKFYGIMYNNKISKVSEISQEEAMTFIEGEKKV